MTVKNLLIRREVMTKSRLRVYPIGSLPKFIDLGLSVKWASYNIGATCEQTAASWYGDYYAWGDVQISSNYAWSTYKHAHGDANKIIKYCTSSKVSYWDGEGDPDNKLILDGIDDVYQNSYGKYFGDKYRIPTKQEADELLTVPHKWVSNFKGIYGLNGRIFAKTQAELDNVFNDDTMLFIPAAGYMNGIVAGNVGVTCILWTSTLSTDTPSQAWRIHSNSSNIDTSIYYRNFGFSIRCVESNN